MTELASHDDEDVRDDDRIAFRIPAPGPWRALGRCRTAPTELFFPERGDDVVQAKKLCAACPVTVECRNYAVPYRDLRGIWGGTSEKERRKLRSDLKRQLAADNATPAPRATTSPRGALLRVLEQLTDYPGRWAKVAEFQSPGSAHTLASMLRNGRRPIPPGLWRFEGRRLDTGGSALWAYYETEVRSA